MQIEPLGVIIIAIGLASWLAGWRFLILAFFVSTLLGAAAAINLTSLGSASMQPAYVLLGFITGVAVVQRLMLREAVASLTFPNEGFWLTGTALYAVFSAIFLPRIFAGETYVYSIARTEIGFGLLLMPLAPATGNITQTIYFLGDVICFLIFVTFARNPAGLKAIAVAAVACAAANLVFAGFDLITYWTGTSAVLGFLRNASYRMLDEVAIGDFKRVVGSFPEASTFAYYTVGLFAFCSSLWLARVWRYATGPIALLSLLALISSTSSSGYVGLAAFLAALFLVGLGQVAAAPVSKSTFVFVLTVPLLALTLMVGLRLSEPGWRIASNLVEQTVLHKLDSQSGIERSLWNQQALTNLADTDGLGGGVGSVRASSFPIAVLGNIGIVGGLAYAAFLLQVLLRHHRGWTDPFPRACQRAARWACFAQLATASVAGSFIDLGLPFFIFAGLSCASSRSALASIYRRPVPSIAPGGAA